MTISFYDLTVGSYLQIVRATEGVLARGRSHCAEQGGDPAALVEAKLAEDMLPLRFQIQSVAHHSVGALVGLERGEFGPPRDLEALDYAGLETLMGETRTRLEGLDRQAVEALAAGSVVFRLSGMALPFKAVDFVLSFSLPNFHFHAATAYDVLRANGVPLGKRDFLGALRTDG